MNGSSSFVTCNAVRLSSREWIYAAVVFLLLFFLVPEVWLAVERFEPGPDYRLPYRVSDDYWMFTRWCGYSSSKYPFLVLGDSVIWGQYVKRPHTLTHYLNDLAGEPVFANLAVDGIHPVAMLGLVKYYGSGIRNKSVIVHINPLWMSSRRHDLQGEEERRFNHPRLVPQIFPDLACYNPSLNEIVGVVAERNVSFCSWANHVRSIYFENLNLQDWTMMNPYKNPMGAITLEVPGPGEEAKSRPVSWEKRRIGKQDFPWVQPEESLQWRSFTRLIELLMSRDNKVFVLLGPFNPYLLTERSLAKYNAVKGQMEDWLRAKGAGYFSVPDLPSRHYADASHPLKEGYVQIAGALFQDESFQQWMGEYRGGEK